VESSPNWLAKWRGGGESPLQDDVGLLLAQQNVFHRAEVLLPRLAAGPEPATQPVGSVEGQQVDCFLPGGGLAARSITGPPDALMPSIRDRAAVELEQFKLAACPRA